MSQEKALKTLESLGFTQLDAKVYVFLAKKGPQKAGDVAKCLKIPKQSIYFILRNLQSDGVVTSTVERPARFSAVPFEKVLDLFVNAKMEEAKQIQRDRSEILSDWQSIALAETEEYTPKFSVLEGRNVIFSKIHEMAQQTKNSLSAMITVPNLVRAGQLGFFDAAFAASKERSIRFKLLTELSEQNMDTVTSIFRTMPKHGSRFEMRAADLGLRLSSRMIIRDDEEAILFIDRGANSSAIERNEVCLWTNCEAIVQSFNFVFNNSWHNATDIYEKMTEFKTGKPSPKTIVIKDSDSAKEKYADIIGLAKKSIFILTPSTELVNYIQKVEGWVSKGISVRIMAPILNENLESARQLMKLCEIKHVPEGYMGTTIIDSQNLFQLKIPIGRKERHPSDFEDTIYTNDIEYVKKTERMLNDIWNNALLPSPTTIESIIYRKPLQDNSERNLTAEYKNVLGLQYIKEPQSGSISQEEVIDKIINSPKTSASNPKKDILKLFGYKGSALIYPPKELDLPNFLIEAFHHTQNSSFGETNTITICAQMKLSDKNVYIQTGFITDNPAGYKFRKKQHRNRQTTEVMSLLKKGQINIQLTNGGVFAGWTAQLPLLPPKYFLPPASLMLESSGEVQSGTSELIGPLERRIKYEFNKIGAFITFIFPSKSYFGPASDGLIYRDFIMTSYPPEIWQNNQI